MAIARFCNTWRSWLRARRRPPRAHVRSLELERLESRDLPAGTWTALTNLAPSSIGTMLLLSDGTVLAQGGGTTSAWYKLTPNSTGSYLNGTWSSVASMSTPRLYGGSAVLPSGKVLIIGGEYSGTSGAQNDTNTGEIYDPVANSWSPITTFPQSNFGDDPIEVLGTGNVLAGYLSGPQTYLYNPAINTWSAAGTKLRSDQSDEETWVMLPDGSILSYDVFSSISSGTGHAQRYVPSTNTWVDAGTVPVSLSSSSIGYELGPGFLLPDGRVFQIGGNSNTAIYTPSTNTWVAGPTIPNAKGADDAPGAVLPNGNVIFAADTPLFHAPTQLFDFDPVANTITQLTLPTALTNTLNSNPSYVDRMLMLPSGEVLFTAGGSQLWDYNPNTAPPASSQPTISSITTSDYVTYTLTGTQLNGLNEGANYGDDAQMASNYPIVQLTSGSGTVYFARTFNWTSQVATGSTAVTTQFTLPAGMPAGTYSLAVIANGVASAAVSFTTPLAVVSTTPFSGAIVATPPTSFVVNFDEAIANPSSVPASVLQVNGLGANSVTFNGAATTATFTYNTSPVTAQGVQSMAIAAGSLTGVDGSTIVAFNASFYYDALTLAVASTSPAGGGTFTLPASSFTYTVTFNEPIDPSFVRVGNLVLSQGTVSAATAQPGNQTVKYTLSGLTSEGTLTVTIPAGTFKDQYDNPAFTAFSGNYLLDDGTVPLPTPLAGVAPYGSLIYNTSFSSLLFFAGDTDHFTVAADPGQTLTVVVTPVASPSSPGPTPTVQLSDPSSTVLGSASASAAGQSALLQTVATTTGGNYTVSIGSQGSTTGNYRVQVYLDAAVEAASVGIGSDNTRATAQNLNASFVTLQIPLASASRGAVLGSVGQVASDTRFYAFTLGAGELATVGLKNLSGSGDALTLQDAGGNTLATGVAGAANLDAAIGNFVAPTSATYYVVVGGSTAATYSLVVTRDGTLSTESHNTMATAQNLSGTQGVLGAVASARPIRVAVQLSSVNASYTTTVVNELNNDTEFSFHAVAVSDAQINTVAQLDNYDVVMLADYGTTISAATAAALKSWVQTGQGGLVASAWLNFNLDNYSSAARTALAAIVPINISTAGNWSYSSGTTITNSANPVTQGVTNFSAANGEAPKGGVVSGATILAKDSTGLPAVVVDQPGDGRSVWLNPDYEFGDTTLTSGAADRLLEQALAWAAPPLTLVDWYQVTLSGGQNVLQVQTQTPLAGPNQAINGLSPIIQLYNSSNSLVASGTLLADGHNQSLLATGLTVGGTYYVKITPASNTSGEYFLGVTPEQSPTVTTNPSNQTVVVGQPATFTAAASGTPVLTVQWQVSTNNGLTYTPLSGATSTIFTIAATSAGQNGNLYEAVFSNAYGSATTAAASLTVQTPPAFTSATPPSSVTAGQTYSFTFAVSGSPPPTLSASNLPPWLTFNPATGVLTGTSTTAATYNNLQVITTNAAGSATTTFNVTVTPATVNQLVFGVPPTNTTAGAALAPAVTVQIEDRFGNLETSDSSDTVTVGLASGPGSFTGGSTTTLTASSGIATFSNLVLNTAGSYTLSDSASFGTGPASNSFAVTPAAVNQLVFGVQPTNTLAGAAIAPAVTVKLEDQFGNVVTTDNTDVVTVAIVSGPTGATFTGGSTTTVTASGGIATFSNLHLNTAGSYRLNETASNSLSGPASSSFTVTPAAVNQLVFGQQPTNTTAGAAIATAVTVQIEDQFGNLETSDSTDAVTVGLASGSGSFTGGSTVTVTAGGGIATFSNLVLNTAGTFTLSANAAGGLTGLASNGFTVTPAAANLLAFGQQPTATAAGAAVNPAVTVLIEDRFGNLISTDSTDQVTVGIGSGPGVFTGASTIQATASGGIATFANLYLNTAGAYTLSATGTSSLGGAASSSFMVAAGAVDHLAVTAFPSTVTAGSSLGLIVTALDQFGNPTTDSGSVTFTSNDPLAPSPVSFTSNFSAGTAFAVGALKTATTTGWTILASDATGHTGPSNLVLVTPAAVSHFGVSAAAVTASAPLAAGTQGASESGATVTITTTTAHGFSVGQSVNIAGVTVAGYNGTVMITSVPSSTSFTYTALANNLGLAASGGGTVTSVATTGSAFGVVVTALDPYGNIATSYNGTVNLSSSDAAASFPVNNYTFTSGGATPDNGVHTFSATLNTLGISQSITATDTSNASIIGSTTGGIATVGLYLTAFAATPSGFTVTFNKLLNPNQLDYYRFPGASVPPDISMTVGATTTTVNGSVVVTSTATQTTLTFVNSGGALAVGQAYTVTLDSGSNGILDAAGGQFAGDANGVMAGTSYSVSVTPVPATAPTLIIPGFARGPGSNVLVPNTGSGIPVTLKNAPANTTSVTFTLDYNPALLNVTGPTSGNLMLLNPGTANSSGVANFAYNGPALNGSSAVLGQIVAAVPSSAASQYKAKALLDLPVNLLTIQGLSSTPAAPFQNADGVELNAYLGDVNADFKIDGSDAALVSGVLTAASQPAGFAAYPLTDPALVGSPNSTATGTPKITIADVTLLNRYVAVLNPAQVPAPPSGLTYTAAGPDPALSLPMDLRVTAGGTVTVPVILDDARPAGSTGLTEATLALTFDPSVFTVSAADVQLGTIPTSGSGWTLTSVVNAATGQLAITLESATPIARALAGSLVTIDFHVKPGAVSGATPVRLVATVNPTGHGLMQTNVFDSQGAFTLSPAPTNAADDPVTGLVVLRSPPISEPPGLSRRAPRRGQAPPLAVGLGARTATAVESERAALDQCFAWLADDPVDQRERHPAHPPVALAAALSGNGFTFASVVGEIMADSVTAGPTPLPMERFRRGRFGLASRRTDIQ